MGDPNIQGVLLWEMTARCGISAVSLGSIASGEGYTYRSSDHRTTVDYVLMDVKAASLLDSCVTHFDEDLNTSDHLAPSAVLACELGTNVVTEEIRGKIDCQHPALLQVYE